MSSGPEATPPDDAPHPPARSDPGARGAPASDEEALQANTNALNASEERFRLLVEGIRDYAIFMLDPDGRIASWNAGAQRFKGYRADEIIGKHFSTFYTREDVERGHPQEELEIATREGRFEEEGWRVRKDGTRFWASVVITALRDKSGTLRGFGKVTRDMTERRERERERASAEIAERQRRFLKDVLASVTQGKLILCDTPSDLPVPLAPEPAGGAIPVGEKTLKALRTRVAEVAAACGLPRDRAQDCITAASEGAMNAVVHAGGGTARVYGDPDGGTVQVFVQDRGKGIALSDLPQSTLKRGYSTGGIGIGHGFWLMLQTCDRVYLLTGPTGTSVVLEQGRAVPDQPWL